MGYPVITKDNFKEFIKNHVTRSDFNHKFINIEMPKNENEFKEFTKNIYGVELSVECFAYIPIGRDDYAVEYKITGMPENKYSKNEIYKLWEMEYGQYDGLKILLNSCFGVLSCGGVANVHYGQTRCNAETYHRVYDWDSNNNQKLKNAMDEQSKALADIFGYDPLK